MKKSKNSKKHMKNNVFSLKNLLVVLPLVVTSLVLVALSWQPNKQLGVVKTRAAEAKDLLVFDEGLSKSWNEWSNADVDPKEDAKAFSGQYSLSVIIRRPSDTLFLKAKSPLDIKSYSYVTFAGLASAGSPAYSLQLLDKNEKPLTDPVEITPYGGNLSAEKWTLYKIPIAVLTQTDTTAIGGIVMRPVSKIATPKIYLDEFIITANGGSLPPKSPTATGSVILPTSHVLPTSTSSPVAPTLPPATPTNPPSAKVPTPTTSSSPPSAGSWWKPTTDKPIDWHWQLSEDFSYPRDVIANVKVYDIDGEKATADTVAKLHALGPDVKVICYFDAGVYENYRSDAAAFTAHPEIIGAKDTGWAGSFWLDIRKTDILLPIMENRIKNWCQAKGFDAVEPDETEVWSNNSGFPLTKADNNTYNQLIAGLAHKYNLAVALKGNTTEAAELVSYFDFSINEQCWQYSECDNMKSFLNANKAVFNIEYNTDPNCTQANAMHMNSARRDLDLMGPTNKSYSIKLCEPYGKGAW